MVNTSMMPKETLKELAFTPEDREELRRMQEREIVFSEDCPEVTPEKAKKFRRVNPPRTQVKTGT